MQHNSSYHHGKSYTELHIKRSCTHRTEVVHHFGNSIFLNWAALTFLSEAVSFHSCVGIEIGIETRNDISCGIMMFMQLLACRTQQHCLEIDVGIVPQRGLLLYSFFGLRWAAHFD